MSPNSIVTVAEPTFPFPAFTGKSKADNRAMTTAAKGQVSIAAFTGGFALGKNQQKDLTNGVKSTANGLAKMLYNGATSEQVATTAANSSQLALKLAEAKLRHMKARENAQITVNDK